MAVATMAWKRRRIDANSEGKDNHASLFLLQLLCSKKRGPEVFFYAEKKPWFGKYRSIKIIVFSGNQTACCKKTMVI